MMDDLEDLARRQARAQNGLGSSHARPQPWFVGSGRGLMLLVVTLVAVLIVARGVSLSPFVQDVRRWWVRHPATQSRASHPPASRSPVRVQSAPPALTTPPHVRPPIGVDAAEWITSDDYPPESIRHEEQGVSFIRWRVDADGRVRRCGTIRSSGYARLDVAACAAIVRRAYYQPAMDASGRAFPTTQQRRVRWVLPTE